jgi:hypothetical protein
MRERYLRAVRETLSGAAEHEPFLLVGVPVGLAPG